MFYPHFERVAIKTMEDMDAFKEKALIAISMLVAHESDKGEYLFQFDNGPARGIIQMEEWVHDDTWKHCDSIQERAKMCGIVKNKDALVYDIRYNVFMARCRFLMDTKPFPSTLEGMAFYLKAYWNTNLGKATANDYLEAYQSWV